MNAKAKNVEKILNNGSLKASDYVRDRVKDWTEKGAKRGLKEVINRAEQKPASRID